MTIYYPILKKGNSEIKALQEISTQYPNVSDKMLPIIEAPQKSDPNKWIKDFKTLGTYLKGKIPNLNFSFQYSTAFSSISKDNVAAWRSSDDQNIVEYIHSILIESCSGYVPCFNYDDDDWILHSVPSKDFSSLVVRIEPYKFEAGIDNIIISGTTTKFNSLFPDKKIIYLVDFYQKFSDLQRVELLISSLVELAPDSEIIFAATSCPEDASIVEHSSFKVASLRTDINSYFKLKTEFNNLKFSDYTVRLKPEPSSEQKSSINMNNTYLKIFYTTDDSYMIAKSGLIKNQLKGSSHITISDACDLVVKSPVYDGSSYSWGDEKINQCSSETFDIHDHQVPIQIGINHHIAKTLNQL